MCSIFLNKLCNTFEDGRVKHKTYQNQGAIKAVKHLPGQNFFEIIPKIIPETILAAIPDIIF